MTSGFPAQTHQPLGKRDSKCPQDEYSGIYTPVTTAVVWRSMLARTLSPRRSRSIGAMRPSLRTAVAAAGKHVLAIDPLQEPTAAAPTPIAHIGASRVKAAHPTKPAAPATAPAEQPIVSPVGPASCKPLLACKRDFDNSLMQAAVMLYGVCAYCQVCPQHCWCVGDIPVTT